MRLSLTHPSPPFRGIPKAEIPPVYGLRKAQASPLADVLVRGPREEPVMVTGEFGLGKVLYVGTSFTGAWGSDWQAWDDFPKWIGQALRWVKRRPEKPRPPRVAFAPVTGGGLEVRVQADPGAIPPEEAPLMWLKPGGGDEPVALPVLRAGSHRYRGRLPVDSIRPGSTLRVEFPPGAGAVPLETEVPVPAPTPFERAHRDPNRQGLEALSRATR
ncbi:MAG: hypothetical protein ACYS47_05810, partial [Planctomycetota bacterium]